MAGTLHQLKHKKIEDLSFIRQEKPVSQHINIVSHIDDSTLVDKNNSLIRIFKIEGINATTLSDIEKSIARDERNSFYKDTAVEIAFYFWSVRRPCNIKLSGDFRKNSFSKRFNNEYQEKLNQTKFFVTDYYIALITKPAASIFEKSARTLKSLFSSANRNAEDNFLNNQQELLEEYSKSLMANFKDYKVTVLGVDKSSIRPTSQPLKLIDYILNHSDFNVPRLQSGMDKLLMRAKPFFNKKKGIVKLQDIEGKERYAAIISIKSYCTEPFAGMLDAVHDLSIEFVVTHSFSPYYRDVSIKKLKACQKEMRQSEDESQAQTEDLSRAIEEVASGNINMGQYHFTICVYADSESELDNNITKIKERVDLSGLVLTREYLGLEIGFWAQLPGNFSYIARGADISTKNLASLISFHNPSIGRISNNHWGEALTVMQTGSGTPYYFNIHAGEVGLGMIYGAQGSGKTVLAGSLILQSMKYGGKRILFDKNYGLKALVLAAEGSYFDLKANRQSCFNPLHLDATPENKEFLCVLFEKMLTIHGNNIDESSSRKIKSVVDNIHGNFSFEERQMCNIAMLFGARGKSILRDKFDEWHTNGRYAWIFDNKSDGLNLNKDIIGFDMTQILGLDEKIRIPIFMYLLHRAEGALDGERGGITIDESWKVLVDEYLRKKLILDVSHDTRKKDNFMLLLNQEPDDVVKQEEIAAALANSSSFSIYYPNSNADKEIYCGKLSFSEFEYELLKTMNASKRGFLLKHEDNKTSEVLRLDLSGMDEILNIISGDKYKNKILTWLLKQYSEEDIDKWMPRFLSLVADMQKSSDKKVWIKNNLVNEEVLYA